MLGLQFIILLVVFNYGYQLTNLKKTRAITETFLKNLKKMSKFKVFEFKDHPFKDYTMSDLHNLLGIREMDPTKYKVSKRKTAENQINIFGNLDNTSNTSTKTSSDTTTFTSETMIFGSDPSTITYADLPENYMVTDRFPFCGSFVKNQGRCASCYAMAITEVLEDRICIKTNSQTIVQLSPQVLVSCDKNNYACQGGFLDKTHMFLNQYGTLTESCFPYTSGKDGTVPNCPNKCQDGKPFKFYRFENHEFFTNSDDMKLEIYKNGPITTGFAVFSDFTSYQGGIYEVTVGATYLGGHAVKVIGWGKENGIEFWICKNSWGTGWGENGFFRFRINHCCSFDSNGIAAQPIL